MTEGGEGARRRVEAAERAGGSRARGTNHPEWGQQSERESRVVMARPGLTYERTGTEVRAQEP